MIDKFFSLQGPSGILETVLTSSDEAVSVVAIICHPHPLYGGSLQHKVVHTLMRTFRELNVASVRFNFRGVGKSQGHYDNGVGEVEDLMAVLNWVVTQYPQATIWLSGFSFGAFIVAKSLMKVTVKIEQVVLVAPPVETFDFSGINFSNRLTCVVMGDQDEIVKPDAVVSWAQQYPNIEMLWLSDADHFFHGKLTMLKNKIIGYLKNTHPTRWLTT
jgi:hypothetical protein